MEVDLNALADRNESEAEQLERDYSAYKELYTPYEKAFTNRTIAYFRDVAAVCRLRLYLDG